MAPSGQDPCNEAQSCSAAAACATAKADGNAAYGAGDLELAAEHYEKALDLWEQAVQASPQPQALEVGQLVRYDKRNFFGVVMSCFPLFDEYFLKDLGSDKAIWVGDEGGDLRRFARKELHAVKKEELDLRQALAQNLAATHLRRKAWEKCVRWADAALVIEGRAPKALLRKGAALLQINQPGPASDVLATCAEVTPKDPEVRRLLREAEARRSPTWVCATGCCGPWGIVCGGPVTSGANAITVAPAEKQSDAGDAESVSTAAATTSDIGPSFKLGPTSCGRSDCSSDCSSDEELELKPAPRRAPAASTAQSAALASNGTPSRRIEAPTASKASAAAPASAAGPAAPAVAPGTSPEQAAAERSTLARDSVLAPAQTASSSAQTAPTEQCRKSCEGSIQRAAATRSIRLMFAAPVAALLAAILAWCLRDVE